MLGLVLLLCLAILGSLAFSLHQNREDLLQQNRQAAASLAQVLDEQTRGTLQTVEMALTVTVRSILLLPPLHPGRDQVIHDLLHESARTLPLVRTLWLLPPDNHQLYSSQPGQMLSTNARDGYIAQHRDVTGRQLHLGRPFKEEDGSWSLIISRRIDQPDGGFGGAIIASLDLGYLQQFFKSVRLGRDGMVSLLYEDGHLLLRSPSSSLGLRAAQLTEPTQDAWRLQYPSQRGTYRAVSSFDQRERLYAYQHVADHPLVIVVGIGLKESLAIWQRTARTYAVLSLAFIALLAWLTHLAWHALRRREALTATLADSEASLTAAQSLSQLGSWKIDLKRKRADWSQEMYRLFGRDLAAGPPSIPEFLALIHPADRSSVSRAYQHLRLYGGDWIGMLRRQENQHIQSEGPPIGSAAGRLRHYRMRATTVRDPQGMVTQVQGTVQDITERHETTEKLRQAAHVFNYTNDAIAITNSDRRIVSVNAAFERITGYSEAEVLGQLARMLHSNEDGDAFFTTRLIHLQREERWQGEVWNRRKNGELYPAHLSINLIRDQDNQHSGYIGVFKDLSDIREATKQVNFLTSHDPLTRLPNRTLLADRLQQAIDIAQHTGQRLAVLLLNLDRLQKVNDSMGHGAGDDLLKEMAARLLTKLQPSDTLARLGSDEFVIVLPEAGDTEVIMRSAQRLMRGVARPCTIHGQELSVTASIGISLYPLDGTTPNDLLKAADTALLHAKEKERNSFCFFTAGMNNHAREWLNTAHQLRAALANDELCLHYQPQICLHTGLLCGMEALVRWQHPQRGLVLPGEFIPVAEEAGLINAIGAWVLHTACHQNKAWQEAGLPAVPVAVNVSARQVTSGELEATIRSALADSGLEPAYLEVELTESTMLHDTEHTLMQIDALRELGVQVSLDDFGTGFSSLGYLSRFTLDKLKIDQSFVRQLATDRKSAAIIQATVALAHGLGMRILAEGVETVDQLDYLRSAGCDEVQGFYFSRAIPVAHMTRMLAQPQRLPVPVPRLRKKG